MPIDRLLEIMSKLRDPTNGCPWDLEQTFETIAPYTLEEAYEVREAITNNDFDNLKDGILADVAPTILKIMGIEKPNLMTGKHLL